jgi:pyridinium-3,5-biscarboxylic acid mononucleotide sulfurtransferase
VEGDLRVRYHDDLARVELPSSALAHWLDPQRTAQLRAAVRGAGFARVALDLRGFRSGSLNVLHGVSAA